MQTASGSFSAGVYEQLFTQVLIVSNFIEYVCFSHLWSCLTDTFSLVRLSFI